jgi:hypothetical protein
MMAEVIDNFIAEITGSPEYVAAAAESSAWAGHLSSIEFGLKEIERRADVDPVMAEALEKAIGIIADDDQHIGLRLHDLAALGARLHEIKGTWQ